MRDYENVQVITDCLAVVGSILREHPAMMAALSKNDSAREFVVSTLARNPAPRVRRQMGHLLVGARPMAGTLLKWLTGELEVGSGLRLGFGLGLGEEEGEEGGAWLLVCTVCSVVRSAQFGLELEVRLLIYTT